VDAGDLAVDRDEDHVERDEGVLHPELVIRVDVEDEEHPVAVGELSGGT
jgi:hypothetical protein